MIDQKPQQTVLIVGETIDGHLSPATAHLGRQARNLAGLLHGQAVGVLTGHRIEAAARTWSRMAGIPVIVLDHQGLRYPNPTMAASGLETVFSAWSPAVVCLPHSMRACQVAATLAWRFQFKCVSAVESLCVDGSKTILKRSIHGGRLCETMLADDSPLILTFMPGAVTGPSLTTDNGSSPAVETVTVPTMDTRCAPLSVSRQPPLDQTLNRARVVVAGGRGLQSIDQVGVLKQVAGIFKDAAVGGSRGACDLGWLPHSLQIGQTGRTVAPALYLACGISGAPQHLAGMQESRTILAVNSDSRAAILNVAHYAVIEDLNTFLPLLLERYSQMHGKGEKQ